jgi:hypothetical protein
MRLKVKDLVATGLVAAIVVPYVDFLVGGDLTLVEDTRGMAGTGLVLALVAFLVLEGGDRRDKTDKVERGLELASLALGVAAYELAGTAAADVLLAFFMGSILVVFAVKLMDHAGVLPMAQHPTGTV